MYTFNKEIFKIDKVRNGFKLYHNAKNKWSSGWTFIGNFKTEEKAKTAARLYTS